MNLREQRKARTRERIRECAIALFMEQGFAQTTVAEVAEAAGVSHMTFFRHFPTKQDVLDFDVGLERLAELVRGRPRDESPLTAVHRAMVESMAGRELADEQMLRRTAQLIMTNAALRAWLWEKHRAREGAIAAALAARSPGAAALQCQAVAATAVAIAGAAFAAWVAADPAPDLAAVLDEAFTTVRHAV